MLTALSDHLVEKPNEDLDGMVLFLLDDFGELRSRWAIRRALASANRTPKTIQRIAKGRNADLCDYYEHIVSEFPSWIRVYVHESSVDKRNGFRQRGWSPRGVIPQQIAQFQRGPR